MAKGTRMNGTGFLQEPCCKAIVRAGERLPPAFQSGVERNMSNRGIIAAVIVVALLLILFFSIRPTGQTPLEGDAETPQHSLDQ